MKPIIDSEKLLELLPHGSGIDYKWIITEHKNGNITAKNAFHAMNENGFYDGIMHFAIHLYRYKKDIINQLHGPCEGQIQILARKGDVDFSIRCNEARKVSFFGLRDYLLETIYFSLESILKRKGE